MAKAATWKIVVKNGDGSWVLDNGVYKNAKKDYIESYETFETALAGFLSWVDDINYDGIEGDMGTKVSLVYIPAKKSKKDK